MRPVTAWDRSEMTQDHRTPPLSGRKLAIFAAVSLVGFVGAWEVAKRVTYASQGFVPSRDEGRSDCDQCALTAQLDGIPYLLAVLVSYTVLWVVVFLLINKRGWFAR